MYCFWKLIYKQTFKMISLTLSFSGLHTFTKSRWSNSQSIGLSRWNIKKNSTIIGRSEDLNSLPLISTFSLQQNKIKYKYYNK